MQTWTPVIITHTAIAVAAMGIGAFTFTRVKGSPIHKLSGRIRVAPPSERLIGRMLWG
jgi:uncharacterized membrane protein